VGVFIMDSADANMKRVMAYLFTGLVGIFFGIIFLVKIVT